jgi:hypothetical protein
MAVWLHTQQGCKLLFRSGVSLVAALGLVAFLVACSASDGETSTIVPASASATTQAAMPSLDPTGTSIPEPTAVPTATVVNTPISNPYPLSITLDRLTLVPSDLGGAFYLGETIAVTNDVAIEGSPDPDRYRVFAESWGRINGYRVIIADDPLSTVVFSTVSLYRESAGAHSSFETGTTESAQDREKYAADTGFEILLYEELDGPTIGDESFRYRHRTMEPLFDDGEPALEEITVQFRDENMLGTVTYFDANEYIDIADVDDLARTMLSRMRGERASLTTATIIPKSPPVITAPIGSEEWWDAYAPIADFRDAWTRSTDIDEELARVLYAALFVTSEWLSGDDPDPRVFGSYVASLAWSELPSEANKLSDEILALPFPSAEGWARPYQNPQTDEEFTLAINLFFAACLSNATLDECIGLLLGE